MLWYWISSWSRKSVKYSTRIKFRRGLSWFCARLRYRIGGSRTYAELLIFSASLQFLALTWNPNSCWLLALLLECSMRQLSNGARLAWLAPWFACQFKRDLKCATDVKCFEFPEVYWVKAALRSGRAGQGCQNAIVECAGTNMLWLTRTVVSTKRLLQSAASILLETRPVQK